MADNIEIEAIHRSEVDVHGCVLALLALARQLQSEQQPSAPSPEGVLPDGEEGDA